MKSPSETAIVWLTGLANVAGDLPREGRPRAYWSQRAAGPAAPAEPLTLAATAERIKKLAQHLEDERYFARTLGFDCVDDRDGELHLRPAERTRGQAGPLGTSDGGVDRR